MLKKLILPMLMFCTQAPMTIDQSKGNDVLRQKTEIYHECRENVRGQIPELVSRVWMIDEREVRGILAAQQVNAHYDLAKSMGTYVSDPGDFENFNALIGSAKKTKKFSEHTIQMMYIHNRWGNEAKHGGY